ncbi:hypothetical protein U737_07700 [Methylomonas sp. LW13]|jgi:hypothetical protein|uniref:hypothetical protein n=1 Tax=unclassified Methylomonas TaxID=2608980 RepID=UPI00051BC743|nr:hypothetical protein [Methylomonas sp. LW13]QBC26793.1 hypothetical protein U737_07700 [Methylomonas sp. LW13]
MSNDFPVEIDGKTGEVETLPPQKGQRYRCKLDTMQDVRREMAKVYREARSGVVDVQDATKLTWCLQAVGKVIEGSDLEKRIEALENKQ